MSDSDDGIKPPQDEMESKNAGEHLSEKEIARRKMLKRAALGTGAVATA